MLDSLAFCLLRKSDGILLRKNEVGMGLAPGHSCGRLCLVCVAKAYCTAFTAEGSQPRTPLHSGR